MSQQNFNIVFLGAQAEYSVVASAFKGFTLKLDVETSIFLNSFVQDCRQYEAIAKFLARLGPDLHSTD